MAWHEGRIRKSLILVLLRECLLETYSFLALTRSYGKYSSYYEYN